jgi:hypothetical protein
MAKQGAPEGNQNNLKHGAYSFLAQGEQALEPVGRTRLAELREQVQDRAGLLSIMSEKCADIVLIFEIVQSYVASEIKRGVPLSEVPVLARLPQFANSMERALANLWSIMPAADGGQDAELIHISEVLNGVAREEPE